MKLFIFFANYFILARKPVYHVLQKLWRMKFAILLLSIPGCQNLTGSGQIRARLNPPSKEQLEDFVKRLEAEEEKRLLFHAKAKESESNSSKP